MGIVGVEKLIIFSQPFWFFFTSSPWKSTCPNGSTTPITVYLLVLSSCMVNIAEKPICRYGVVDTFVPCHLFLKWNICEQFLLFLSTLYHEKPWWQCCRGRRKRAFIFMVEGWHLRACAVTAHKRAGAVPTQGLLEFIWTKGY